MGCSGPKDSKRKLYTLYSGTVLGCALRRCAAGTGCGCCCGPQAAMPCGGSNQFGLDVGMGSPGARAAVGAAPGSCAPASAASYSPETGRAALASPEEIQQA